VLFYLFSFLCCIFYFVCLRCVSYVQSRLCLWIAPVLCLMSKIVCVSGLLLFCVLCPKSSLSLDCSFGFLLRLFKQKYMLKGSDNKQSGRVTFILERNCRRCQYLGIEENMKCMLKFILQKLLTGKHRIQTCTIVSPFPPFVITFTNSYVKYKDNC
jgi:hypothetical protein